MSKVIWSFEDDIEAVSIELLTTRIIEVITRPPRNDFVIALLEDLCYNLCNRC